MSISKRPNSPYYYTDFTIRGHRIFRSTGTSSRREAEAFERRLKEEVRQEIGRKGAREDTRAIALDYTIDQMFGRYWTEHGSKLRWAAEVAGYAKRIIAIIGDIKVQSMTAVDAAHLVETLRDVGTGKVAINRAIAVLRSAHTMAAKRWGIPVHTIDWRQLKSKEPRERIRWITREEAAALLASLPAHIGVIVEFALYTGLRKNEVVSLEWEHVNLGYGWLETKVKGGYWRRILLSDATKDVLLRTPKNGAHVFDSTNLRKHFEAGLRSAGITNFRFHDLRHTCATWMRREGASLEIIQRAFGHSSIQVTQRYAHVDDQEVLAAGNKIDVLTKTNIVSFQKPKKPEFVYFITDGDAVKIGKSNDPQRRLHTLQVGHPKKVRLVGTIATSVMTELDAHRRFADGKIRGEWFAVGPKTISDIEELCRDMKPRKYGVFDGA